MQNEIDELKQIISEAGDIVFFGGAGVSTESGVPDFRSSGGLYKMAYKYPPEAILSHSFFISNTEDFFDFYRHKMICHGAKPNACHRTLAVLEAMGKLSAVITQNIDGLHQQAGSVNVLELHGSVHRNYCMKCRRFFDVSAITVETDIPHCLCGGIIKPDVVLYEEPLDGEVMMKAVKHISGADVLIVGGTSLSVYPAAGLVDYFGGRHLVVINKDREACSAARQAVSRMRKAAYETAVLCVNGNIGEVFGELGRFLAS